MACRRKRDAFVCVLSLLIVLLVGCHRERERPPETETVTIRFAIHDYQQPLYEKLVERFAETNPDVHVELVFEEEILGRTSEGSAVTVSTDDDLVLAREADVFKPLSPQLAAETGALLDLSPFIAAEPNFDPADFYPGLLEQFQLSGSTWAIPIEGNYILIYYNEALFDAAGVVYPEPGWSWDDFLAAAIALTASEGEQNSQWGFLDPYADPLYFVQSRSGSLLDQGGNSSTARIDRPEVADAVRWYADLFRVYEVTRRFDPKEAEELIRAGQVAMWVDSSTLWNHSPPDFRRGVVPFPVDAAADKSTPVTYTPALGISAGTHHSQAAWRWLLYLSRQAPVRPSSVEPMAVPARRSVTAATNFWEQVDEALRPSLEYAVEHAYVPVRTKGFRSAVEAVIAGELGVEEALAQAQAVAEAWLAERQQATPAATVVMSAPEAGGEETGGVTIAFKVSDSSRLQTYRALAEAFHALNPDVSVDVSAADLAGEPSGLQGMAAAADCFQAAPIFDATSVRAVLSLEPFFDADPSLQKADFFPQAIDAFTTQAQLRGLPAEITVSVIEYNRDLFDAAGAPYPGFDWSRDDFLQTAVALTQGSGDAKQYGFVPDLYEPGSLVDFLALSGAQLVDASVDPPALNFSHPGVVAAMKWYVALTTSHEVKPLLLTTSDGEPWTAYETRQGLINEARTAMWSDSGGFAGGVGVTVVGGSEEGPDRVGVAPLPSAPDGEAYGSYRTSSGYFISAQSQAAPLCWRWLTFLSQQPDIIRGLPARQAVAGSAAYRQQVGAERAAVYLATVAEATEPSFFRPFSQHPWLEMAFIWLAQAYDEVVSDGVAVETALARAQQKADAYRECLAERDGFQDLGVIQACSAEVGGE